MKGDESGERRSTYARIRISMYLCVYVFLSMYVYV